jgi:hypothetical protein
MTTTTYTIKPAPIRREMLLRFIAGASAVDIERASNLARALGGRWVRASHGFHLRPVAARRLDLLFRAGLNVARKYKPAPTDCYFSTATPQYELTLRNALFIARKLQPVT